ncbi:MAG TPA: hypothetical protein VMH39_00705 [Gemmatimonadaceae bacterium]|nr:hypothetical protein [Gemmatimonadaceae bacterium]
MILEMMLVAIVDRHAAQPQRVTVGVLENPDCRSSKAAIRPLFARSDTAWFPINDRRTFGQAVTKQMSWGVVFGGRELGTLATIYREPPEDAWFVRDLFLDLKPAQQIPRRDNPTNEFGGGCQPPSNRPLVATTGSRFADPEGWTPVAPSAAVLDSIFPAFRRAVGNQITCLPKSDRTVALPYAAGDLRVVGAYRNRRGRTIVGVELSPETYSCDGPIPDGFQPHWFVTGPRPVLLGADLVFVDVGDYDGDGKSDFIFFYRDLFYDGYTLFTSDFTKRVDVRWGYH